MVLAAQSDHRLLRYLSALSTGGEQVCSTGGAGVGPGAIRAETGGDYVSAKSASKHFVTLCTIVVLCDTTPKNHDPDFT